MRHLIALLRSDTGPNSSIRLGLVQPTKSNGIRRGLKDRAWLTCWLRLACSMMPIEQSMIVGRCLKSLASTLPKTERSALSTLLSQARRKTVRIWAEYAPFELKNE